MNAATSSPLEHIRDAIKTRIFVAACGAGLGLPNHIFSVPGCSSFFVGAALPYATDATDDFLGFKPEKYCSAETAIDLAMRAYWHAFVPGGAPAVGIGVTASVASTTAHRGAHRVFAASFSDERCTLHAAELEKGAGADQRWVDGLMADTIALNAIADAFGMSIQSVPTKSYTVTETDHIARERLFALPYFRWNGAREKPPEALEVAFPGAFDPPHEGHWGAAFASCKVAGRTPTFWITTDPPHKSRIQTATALQRAKLLRGTDVLFTRGEPLYLDKARRFPGCAFVIGADAMARMLDPKWGPPVEPMLDEFRKLGTRFLVVRRRVDGPDAVSVSDIPGAPADLCIEVPGRWDVSSTELRARR